MQTDPNWANFLYNPATDKIGLLDFGATREYKPSFVNTYFKIIDAAAHKKRDAVLEYSRDIGFLTGYESKVRYILNYFKLMKDRCKGYVPSMEYDIFQCDIAFACSCFYYFLSYYGRDSLTGCLKFLFNLGGCLFVFTNRNLHFLHKVPHLTFVLNCFSSVDFNFAL
jgi:hypothetical protein